MVRLSLAEIQTECILDNKTGILTYQGNIVSVVYVRIVLYYVVSFNCLVTTTLSI